MAANLNEIPYIDITVKQESLQDDLFRICNQLYKDTIKLDEVEFEVLQGGYINSIVLLKFKKNQNKSFVFRTFNLKFSSVKLAEEFDRTFDQLEIDENQNALKPVEKLKDFSDVIFSRTTEYQVMHELSKFNLCQKVYGRYNNGIVYGYLDGILLNGPLMLTNDFMNECAKKLAIFHSVKFDNPSIKFKTHYDRIFVQFAAQFKIMMENVDKEFEKIHEYPFNELPRIHSLFDIEDKIFGFLNELGFGRIEFSHNDTNQKNIIWNPQTKTIAGFIDFEMTMNNYIIFEFGFLFGCYAGHFLTSFESNHFPNDEYRRKFLRKYLLEFNKLNDIKLSQEKFEDELEDLFIRVNLTTLLFFSRLIMNALMWEAKPEMFKNDDLEKAKKETKWHCAKFALKIWYLFDKLEEPFLKSAEEHLKKKK